MAKIVCQISRDDHNSYPDESDVISFEVCDDVISIEIGNREIWISRSDFAVVVAAANDPKV
jgi:hypothetical protein